MIAYRLSVIPFLAKNAWVQNFLMAMIVGGLVLFILFYVRKL